MIIIGEVFLPHVQIIVRLIVLVDDDDIIGPICPPFTAEELEELLKAVHLLMGKITIEFLQRLVDTDAKERFNALFLFRLYLIDILQFKFLRTLFVTTEAGMGVHRHAKRQYLGRFNAIVESL
jgi:hypothetical protein